MPEDDVVYSDVKITTGRRSRSAETTATYCKVKIAQTDPTTEPENPDPQRPTERRGTLTLERVALLVLCLLLAVAVTALVITHRKNIETKMELEKLQSNFSAVEVNATAKGIRPERCKAPHPMFPDWTGETCWTCDRGWERHGGMCYFFTSTPQTWSESKTQCIELGGDLVVINSKDEQEFLVSRLTIKMKHPEDKFWIGLTDSKTEGSWTWVDGSPLNTSWNFWLSQDPDNWTNEDPEGEDCVRMGEQTGAHDLKCWLDKSCKIPHKSICEKQLITGFYTCTNS